MGSDEHIAALVARFGVASSRTGTVLLVDDEELNLRVLRGFVEDHYQVVVATSGAQALEIARSTPLDVVITDQRMPGMTGVELLERLRVEKPDVAGIVLTGFIDAQAMESAINRAGVFRFLKKPFQPDEMLASLQQASEHVEQRRTIRKLVQLLSSRTDELTRSLDHVRAHQEQVLHMERLSTMGQLAAGVMHDLRNVTVSLQAVEWEIAQTATAPELVETLQIGMKGVESLLQTLDAMYHYSRGGEISLNIRPVAPEAVVKDALAIARMDKNFRMRTVELDVAPDLPRVQGDQQKLTQVLVNLVRNALQVTHGASGVRVRALHGTKSEVLLSVEDDGPGIEESLRLRLFQPFISSKGEQGMGMGLYMARLIVESHHGTISCRNRPEGGAQFQVALPGLAIH